MIALVILIVFGLGMAYFATQNTGLVHILVGNYMISGVPIYVLVVVAILLGIFVSWLINMVGSVSSLMALRGKDSALHKAQKAIADLEEKNRNLSLENAKLKGQEETEGKHHKEEASVNPHAPLFKHIGHHFA